MTLESDRPRVSRKIMMELITKDTPAVMMKESKT